jgi:hypothetical protein
VVLNCELARPDRIPRAAKWSNMYPLAKTQLVLIPGIIYQIRQLKNN